MKIFLLLFTLLLSFQAFSEIRTSNTEYFNIALLDEATEKLGLKFKNYPISEDGTQTYELFADHTIKKWKLSGISLIYFDENNKKILQVGGMSHCEEKNNWCIMIFRIVHSELKNTKLRFYYSSNDYSKFREYDVGGLSVLTKR